MSTLRHDQVDLTSVLFKTDKDEPKNMLMMWKVPQWCTARSLPIVSLLFIKRGLKKRNMDYPGAIKLCSEHITGLYRMTWRLEVIFMACIGAPAHRTALFWRELNGYLIVQVLVDLNVVLWRGDSPHDWIEVYVKYWRRRDSSRTLLRFDNEIHYTCPVVMRQVCLCTRFHSENEVICEQNTSTFYYEHCLDMVMFNDTRRFNKLTDVLIIRKLRKLFNIEFQFSILWFVNLLVNLNCFSSAWCVSHTYVF